MTSFSCHDIDEKNYSYTVGHNSVPVIHFYLYFKFFGTNLFSQSVSFTNPVPVPWFYCSVGLRLLKRFWYVSTTFIVQLWTG